MRESQMNKSARSAVVAGLGAWVPPTVITNADLSSSLGVSDSWILTRTGIRQRHVIQPGESTGDIATAAGQRALKSAQSSDVDLVVVATSTPDHSCPATAPEVASRLGLSGVGAFDVSAVCTGFVYALAVAAGLIEAAIGDTALVIGADTFSTILNPTDGTTRSIFGDGAGAIVLRLGDATEPGRITGFHLDSDGSRRDLIEVPAGGSRQRSTGIPAEAASTYFHMEGKAVFAEAVRRMTTAAQKTATLLGWRPDDIDRIVLHQANARILAAVAERIGVPLERFPSNIEWVGNTVAASIPLALAHAVESGDLRPGHRVILTGFGGGLTWGSAGLVWPDITLA